MLKTALLTVLFGLSASRGRAIYALTLLAIITAAEVTYVTLHHNQSILHGLRAFWLVHTISQLVYLLALFIF